MEKLKPCKDCGTAKIIWKCGLGNIRPAWYIVCSCGVGGYEPVDKQIYAEQQRKKRKLIEQWNRRVSE